MQAEHTAKLKTLACGDQPLKLQSCLWVIYDQQLWQLCRLGSGYSNHRHQGVPVERREWILYQYSPPIIHLANCVMLYL